MTTRNNMLHELPCFPPTDAGRKAGEAIGRFLASPSRSNKVAAVVALQACFAEVELAALDGRQFSPSGRST